MGGECNEQRPDCVREITELKGKVDRLIDNLQELKDYLKNEHLQPVFKEIDKLEKRLLTVEGFQDKQKKLYLKAAGVVIGISLALNAPSIITILKTIGVFS